MCNYRNISDHVGLQLLVKGEVKLESGSSAVIYIFAFDVVHDIGPQMLPLYVESSSFRLLLIDNNVQQDIYVSYSRGGYSHVLKWFLKVYPFREGSAQPSGVFLENLIYD